MSLIGCFSLLLSGVPELELLSSSSRALLEPPIAAKCGFGDIEVGGFGDGAFGFSENTDSGRGLGFIVFESGSSSLASSSELVTYAAESTRDLVPTLVPPPAFGAGFSFGTAFVFVIFPAVDFVVVVFVVVDLGAVFLPPRILLSFEVDFGNGCEDDLAIGSAFRSSVPDSCDDPSVF